MVCGRIAHRTNSNVAALNNVTLVTERHSRCRCVRPRAVASSDVRADDTAEARRRLARQFRRHKLEPQQLAAPADINIQGLRRPQHQQQPFVDPQLQTLASGHTAIAPTAAETDWSNTAASLAGSTAATRQQLERQFLLGSDLFPASSIKSHNSSSQLPVSLLLDTVSSTAGKEFTKAIMRAGHWREVQSLVQEHGPDLSAIHLCASLTRLAHLQDSLSSSCAAIAARQAQSQQKQKQSVHPQAAAFLLQLFDSIAAVQKSLEHRQACNVLWAASKLRHIAQPSTEWLVSMYEYAFRTTVTDPLGKHAAQLAYSLEGLQDLLPPQQVEESASRLLAITQVLMQEHLYPQQEQQGGSQQHVQLEAAGALVTARDLATIAWSFASLGLQPSTAWLSAYVSVISCSSRGVLTAPRGPLLHRDISNLLWATAVFSKSAAEGSAAANTLHAAAAALLHACEAQDGSSLRSWDSQSVSNTLWALATLGQRPSIGWLNKLLQHVERTAVMYMTPQGISVTLWALGALGVVPSPTCRAALLRAASEHMKAFTPQAASNTIWALAVLEEVPSKDWLAGFWPRCRTLLSKMTSQALVNCLWAVARLGVQPPQEWVVDAARLLLAQGVQHLNSQGLSNVLWAMARISNRGRQGQELLDAALQQAVVLLEQQQLQEGVSDAAVFNIFELSGLMHTVALLRVQQQQMAGAVTGNNSSGRSAGRSSSPVRHSSSSRSSSPVRTVVQQQFTAHDVTGAAAEAGPVDQLLPISALLQSASLPLLQKAGPSELSILLWSQVSMAAAAAQSPEDAHNNSIPRQWMDAWLAASKGSFGAASSRDLAQWLWCLGKRGVRPSGQWMASFQVASYRQMVNANSQDLSNMLWAFASLGITPDPAWLQQHLREVNRRQAQRQLLPQHLANMGWALAKLGHRPDRDWLARYQEDVYAALPEFKPQEMSNVLWALAVLNSKAERALLNECQSFMASNLASFKANEVAVSLWALARLRGQPGVRLMGAALQHCFTQARQLTPKGLSMLMWSVGNMEIPPPKAWLVKLLVATQVRMSGFSAQELSMLAVSLARLEYRPPDAWLDCFAAAAAAQFSKFEAQTLANTLWALATLHYTPSEDWMAAFDAQLQQHVTTCTPAHIAMTMWAMSRLQWLPVQPLWQQLQERAELHSASFCLRSQRMLSRAIRVLEKVESEDEE